MTSGTFTIEETVSRIAHAKNESNPSTSSTSWAGVPSLSIQVVGIDPARNVRLDFSGLVGKSEAGMVQVALFRDGNLMEVGPAVYLNLPGDIAPLVGSWVDAAHGGGDHTYDIRWRVWSGTAYLGRRGDNQYVTNVPAYFIATEYAA